MPAAGPPSAALPKTKNIVILCDGTGNRDDAMEDGKPATTNVAKLYAALPTYVESGWTQVKWYDPGVGTMTSRESVIAQQARNLASWVGAKTPTTIATFAGRARMALELATGAGILENITQGYTQLVHHYRPGDRIFLFGFSRGAYTARCI